MNREESYKVLVVEDEKLIRDNLVKKIHETGSCFHVAATAHNGKSALEIIQNIQPHVLMTDIRMPVMDGLELIREVYYSHPFMKIIIISGYDDFKYAQTALRYGVKDYILKPVNKKELQKILNALLIQLEKDSASLKSKYTQYPETTAQEYLAKDIAEYLRSHYTEQISLSELADLFYVNPAYLTRIFKKDTGIVPSKYLQDLRINEAKKLLLSFPEMEVKEIASIIGYTDQCYFSRLFKKAVGMSPMEFREKGQE